MKTMTRKVYYCDYCKKRYLIKKYAEIHEKHCTANPERDCRLCQNSTPEILKKVIDKYSGCYIWIEEKNHFGFIGSTLKWEKELTIKDLMEDVDGCPVCALAVLRQCNLLSWPGEEKFKFDYKKEIELWWKESDGPYY